jgi:hypothetical protein
MKILHSIAIFSAIVFVETPVLAASWNLSAIVLQAYPSAPLAYQAYVSVSDENGAPVNGLTAQNFNADVLSCAPQNCIIQPSFTSSLEPETPGTYEFRILPPAIQDGSNSGFVIRVFSVQISAGSALNKVQITKTQKAQLLVHTN